MIGVGFGAGIEQATNSFSGYGQGASGYAKRYAAKFIDGRSSDFLTHAIFPSLFHQDPRYFYLGSGYSFKSRLAHAVGSAFFTRSDAGHTEPNYSYLLGDVSSAALSNLYYPQANRGASLVLTNAAVGLAGRIGGNVLREFSKRITTNTPDHASQYFVECREMQASWPIHHALPGASYDVKSPTVARSSNGTRIGVTGKRFGITLRVGPHSAENY